MYHMSLSPTIKWRNCGDCKHLFTEGYFTDQALKLIFSKTQVNQQVGYDFEKQRFVSARMVDKVLPYAMEGIWLDVGFGNGSLLFTAQEYGFIPIGVDLREDSFKKLSSLGIQAYSTTIEELTLNDKCSVISLADVLEHVPFPKTMLHAAHGLLEDEGVLFISIPNADSIAWKLLTQQNLNPYWGEIEHYHNFGRERLNSLLRECRFEPITYNISERYRLCMEIVAKKK
jgi:SAM-dependent methyltransferase